MAPPQRLTIVATAGASNANSYVTLAEAEEYFCAKPDSAWSSETKEDLKIAALIQATRTFEALPWMGKKYQEWPEGHTLYQALAWPRIGRNSWESWDANDGLPYCFDSSSNLIIPRDIKWALMEQANFVLGSGGLGDVPDRVKLQQQGVRSFTVPGLSEQYSGTPRALYSYAVEALQLVKKYLMEDIKVFRA